jgi:hypothetical protein
LHQVKRNKEFIATNIVEVQSFNPFNNQLAQMSQPIDLQKLFMHQLVHQQIPAHQISPQMVQQQQELAMQAAAAAAAAVTATNVTNVPSVVPSINGSNSISPSALLNNGCTTMVTNTNINVTYLNGAVNVNNKYDNEKFKMHQGFIAVLKVRDIRINQVI